MRSAALLLPAAEAALHSGEPVVTGSVESPLVGGWWADTFGIESLLAVAIGSPPRAVGVLVVDDAQPDRFSAEDVRLVAAAAAHIAPDDRAGADERRAHARTCAPRPRSAGCWRRARGPSRSRRPERRWRG